MRPDRDDAAHRPRRAPPLPAWSHLQLVIRGESTLSWYLNVGADHGRSLCKEIQEREKRTEPRKYASSALSGDRNLHEGDGGEGAHHRLGRVGAHPIM